LTEEFKGDFLGKGVDLNTYTVREMLTDFPNFIWSISGASNYWRYTNIDTTVFYIKADDSIPRFQLAEKHYLDKKIDGVKSWLSCWDIYGPNYGSKDTIYIKPLYAPLDNVHANYYLERRSLDSAPL
jgi:hypothetical protein